MACSCWGCQTSPHSSPPPPPPQQGLEPDVQSGWSSKLSPALTGGSLTSVSPPLPSSSRVQGRCLAEGSLLNLPSPSLALGRVSSLSVRIAIAWGPGTGRASPCLLCFSPGPWGDACAVVTRHPVAPFLPALAGPWNPDSRGPSPHTEAGTVQLQADSGAEQPSQCRDTRGSAR